MRPEIPPPHDNPELIPVSGLIPTRHRSVPLRDTLRSLAGQSAQPAEIIIIDASADDRTEQICNDPPEGLQSAVRYFPAETRGAAAQRNEGYQHIKQEIMFLMDDDLLFEPESVSRLYCALKSDDQLGAVNAMLTNQQYGSPGKISNFLFKLFTKEKNGNFAGRCIGPAVNLLPADDEVLPVVVPTEWLNTTCTMYRCEALPSPPFSQHFTGYSMFEDVTLSLIIGRSWKLANARTARVFHDSQPGDHKQPAELAKMSVLNRYFVMRRIMGKNRLRDHFHLVLWEAFNSLGVIRQQPATLLPMVYGKSLAFLKILTGRALPAESNTTETKESAAAELKPAN